MVSNFPLEYFFLKRKLRQRALATLFNYYFYSSLIYYIQTIPPDSLPSSFLLRGNQTSRDINKTQISSLNKTRRILLHQSWTMQPSIVERSHRQQTRQGQPPLPLLGFPQEHLVPMSPGQFILRAMFFWCVPDLSGFCDPSSPSSTGFPELCLMFGCHSHS